MPIPASILERVETFSRNLESYLSPDYKETQLRREFLDPLFAALGRDIANHAGHAEAYKDVDTLRIAGVGTSAPDEATPAALPPEAYAQAEADAAHHYFVKEPPPAAQN